MKTQINRTHAASLARSILRLESQEDFGGLWAQARREFGNEVAKWHVDQAGGGSWRYRLPNGRLTCKFEPAIKAWAKED